MRRKVADGGWAIPAFLTARWWWSVALVAVGMLAMACASSLGSAAWALDSMANSVAVPGSPMTFFIQVQNVGDAPADGSPVTFTAHLPTGMTAVSAGDTFGTSGQGFSAAACHGPGGPADPVAGASAIVCETSTGFLAAMNRRDTVIPRVTVDVSPLASGTLTARFEVAGGGASEAASVLDPSQVGDADAGFGVDAFDGQVVDKAGAAFSQAGGHPYAISTAIDFNRTTNANPFLGEGFPAEPIKDADVALPLGFVGNPGGVAKCTSAQLANSQTTTEIPLCPPSSQIGRVKLLFTAGKVVEAAVYNVVPPPDAPARFGFNIAGTVVVLDAALGPAPDYKLSVNASNISEALAVSGTSITLWGVPADASHNGERACAGERGPYNQPVGPTCATDAPRTAFLRNPTSCTPDGVGVRTALRVDSWAHPGVFKEASFVSHDAPGYPAAPAAWGPQIGPSGCEKVPFAPTFKAAPVEPARAGAPSAFAFDLSVPQGESPEAIGQADLKKAVVTLPAGVRVSPSSADGLGACTPAQIQLDTTAPPTCPNASKIGSLEIETPLLDKPLTGNVYLASPHDNPEGSLIGLYLVAEGSGVVLKLFGHVETDPVTGQIKTTFDNNPQFPFSNLHLQFKDGPRAPLVNPARCGTYTTHAVMTGWNGKVATSDSSFSLDLNSKGGPCAPLKFSPTLAAGSVSPVAGKHTSFVLRLARGDDDEDLRTLSVAMPGGLLATIADLPLCSETRAAAGSCGEESRIGSVTTAAGAGPNPFWLSGRVYLAGPYKGAPFSLSIVVPAVAGPFDLGNVVVRAALRIDKRTAALNVDSDPLPTALEGIPLQVREIRVAIDRKRFILNPTSCAVKQLRVRVGSTEGSVANLASRFQVGECANLPLNPKLRLQVGAKGRTRPGVSTPLVTTLTQTPGQSNLKRVTVTLPLALNALLPVVTDACTLEQFHAGQCERARTGTAIATTPLLKDPVRGGAYFVKNPMGGLPNLMVALRGQVDVDLTGKVIITPKQQRLSTSFETIPDVPVKKFTLRLDAGRRHGALGVVQNLCAEKARRQVAIIEFEGQNGRSFVRRQHLAVAGCGKH